MNKVLSYMDSLDREDSLAANKDAIKNSVEYKIKCLNDAKCKAREASLQTIFTKLYKDAVPLSNTYKTAYNDGLGNEFHDYISGVAPEGLEMYIKERKHQSPACKRLMTAVERFVDNYYREESFHPENINTDELVFDADDPENMKVLNTISDDVEFQTLADSIAQNVTDTARNEIERAKMNKEKNELIEKQLENDLKITESSQAVDVYNRLMGTNGFYTPTLMEGMVVGMTNRELKAMESGEGTSMFTYEALAPIGKVYTEEESSSYASPAELAFIEAVKEMTKHSIISALKLESYTKRDIDDLAMKYASM